MDELNYLKNVSGDNYSTLSINNKSKFINPYENLKRGIWLYLLLLIFEGGLRKWVFPDLATPLLLVRDPLAIWLLIIAWKRGVFVFNVYVVSIYIIAITAFFTAIFFGHGNFFVGIYGVRTLIVHFPLIFIIGNVFNYDDVLKIGKFIVWLTPPMTILLFLQFYSPQSSFVNRGVGGDVAGGGFSGALGFFRPPATFSFTNGTALFYSLSACFIFYFWLGAKQYINKTLLICATVALLISIPLSISRTLFFSILVTAFFILIAMLRRKKYILQVVIIVVLAVGSFAALSQLKLFQTATEAFTTRFSDASETEGGLQGTLQKRVIQTLIGPIANSDQLPFWGYGIGMGTNVGSMLLTGKNQFLVSETEWGRLIGEMGILMGGCVILVRLILTGKIALASFRTISTGELLPWILTSYCIITLPQAQWAQPTALGFSVFVAGLTVASIRIMKKTDTTLNKPQPINSPAQIS
jgi:hypothetical protein